MAGQSETMTLVAAAGIVGFDVMETVTGVAGRKSESEELTVLMLTIQTPGAVICTTPYTLVVPQVEGVVEVNVSRIPVRALLACALATIEKY